MHAISRRRVMYETSHALELSLHHDLLRRFLNEDLGAGDATTAATVGPDRQALGRFVAKSPLVLAGLDIAFEVFRLLDASFRLEARHRDGERLKPGSEFAVVRGPARAMLSGERLALNLLQRLSGIATLTRQYVETVAGAGARILDTRKTTPGLRAFEKYAVRAGGGWNHRLNLSDAILIKDNHIRMAGGIRQAVAGARAARSRARFVGVEVTTLEELREALAQRPDIILLDNMTPSQVRTAVATARARDKEVLLEASGGITLKNARQYAEAGVDWISTGALTHSAPAADISMEVEPDA